MPAADLRPWIIRWLYAAALVHLLIGLLLPWITGSALLDPYHRSVEAFFWQGEAPAAARAQQVWWMSLFGATLQSMALWMLALVHIGARTRLASIWLWLAAGLLLWAPQDMLISAQAAAWSHLAVDTFALLVLLPPLFWLYRQDRQTPARLHEAQQPIANISP